MKYALSVKQSLLFTDLSLLGCSKKYFEESLNIDYSFPECLIREDDLFWNFDNDLLYDKAFLNNQTLNESVKYFINSLVKRTSDLEEVTKRIAISKKWKSENKTVLESTFNQYIEAYLLNMPFLFHFWNTEHLLISKLKIDFGKIFGEKEKENKLQQVLFPYRETYFTKERKSIEEIALYISKKKDKLPKLKIMLNKHIKLFGFTSFVLHLGEPQNQKSVLERVQEVLKDDILHKIKVNKRQTINEKRRIEKILKKLKPYPEIYKKVRLAQELMFWKNQRLDILFKSDLLVKPLFDKIANLAGLSYKEFVHLQYKDIKDWFKNGKLPSKQEIKRRMKSYALYLKNRKISLFTDRNKYPKVTMDSELEKLNTKQISVIKGSIAYKGKVTGKVRLINSMDDIKSLQRGEILVTKMTRPEMILGLEKAAAFITDQGGMLSHVAIVSREMKKPCIVGTKIATQILKNGDQIEVDADNGIVRKLN